MIGSNYAAALLSETWSRIELETTKRYNVSRYKTILSSRDDGYGIYLRNDLSYQPIDLPRMNHYTQVVAVKVAKLNTV